MSFTGNETTPTLGAIENDGFWPELDADFFLKQYHISDNYDSELLIDALVLAMIDINQKLNPVKTSLQVNHADFETYTAVNSTQVNGEEILIKKYQQAVFSYAKAHFLDVSKDSNRREEAKSLAAEMPETKEEWLSKSAKAVNFLFSALLPDETATVGIRARLITPQEPVFNA